MARLNGLLSILPQDSRRMLLWIVLLGTALRLGVAAYQGDEIDTLPGIYDQVSYHSLAIRVLDGHGFSFGTNWWPATKANEPTAHWSFLYTLYLVAVYAVFGIHPLAARLVQTVAIGILQPWLTWRIARRLSSDRVALVASLISAVYAYFVYYAGALMSEGFYILAVLWVLDLAMRLGTGRAGQQREGERLSLWLMFGLALGVTVLLRQVFLLVVPLFLAWLVAVRIFEPTGSRSPAAEGFEPARGRRRLPLLGLGSACAILMVTIVPWTIRNYIAFDQFVLLNTNAGFAFFWGNHPIHKDHFIPILPPGGPTYVDLLPVSLKKLNEASLDRALMKRGIGFVLDDPGRYARLSLSRCVEYFRFWPSGDSGLASNLVRFCSFGLLLPFVLIGLGDRVLQFAKRDRRKLTAQSANASLLLIFIFFYSLIHCLSWTLIRYRLPVDAALVFFAASGLWICLRPVLGAITRAVQPGSMERVLEPGGERGLTDEYPTDPS